MYTRLLNFYRNVVGTFLPTNQVLTFCGSADWFVQWMASFMERGAGDSCHSKFEIEGRRPLNFDGKCTLFFPFGIGIFKVTEVAEIRGETSYR